MADKRTQSVRKQLVKLDVVDRLRGLLPPIPAQIFFGTMCSLAAIGTRTLLDMVATGAGPFGLTMPFVLLATLFGRWRSGVITMVLLMAHAWYFVLPVTGSFLLENNGDAPRIAVNVLSGGAILAMGELFRRSVRAAVEDREMLISEIDHRVANNFASILAMLRLQRSRADHEAAKQALDIASGRVESYARAHQSLYRDGGLGERLHMQEYFSDLCEALESVLSEVSGASIRCWADDISLPRDQAVTLGLIVNEVVTNSAKHAFADFRGGLIRVTLDQDDGQNILCIADNGSGMKRSERDGGLGMSLINALAQQANATMDIDTGSDGTTFRFAFPA